MEQVPVIIPLGPYSKYGNRELKYLLRSMEAHLKGHGRIYLATVCPPDWLDVSKVTVVPVRDDGWGGKDQCLWEKTIRVIRDNGLDRFLWTADDACFMRDIHVDEIPKMFNRRSVEFFEQTKKAKWRNRVYKTFLWAKSRGVDLPWNFEVHAPQVFSGRRILDNLGGVDYLGGDGLTIYTGWRVLEGTWAECTVNQNDWKFTLELIDRKTLDLMPDGLIASKPLLGYNDAACDAGLLDRLERFFPNPSRYEV